MNRAVLWLFTAKRRAAWARIWFALWLGGRADLAYAAPLAGCALASTWLQDG